MGRLLAQAHPDLVLLSLLGRSDGIIDHRHKSQHDQQLHIRIKAQTLQQLRVLVIQMLLHPGSYGDVDHVGP